jgi:site-specific DNA-methyltransferase (adenine-specific)
MSKKINTKHKIIHSDVISGLKKQKDMSFDLVIADPPYNIMVNGKTKLKKDHKIKGMGGAWSIFNENWDKQELAEYIDFTMQYLSEVKRVVKKEGSIWIFGTYHNIGIVNICLRLLNIEILNEVIWYKKNAFPNLANRRLTASHENIIWAHGGTSKKRKYRFNGDYAKGIDNEFDDLKVQGKQLRTVWSMSNNKKKYEINNGSYPTQKPLKILRRLIRLTTKENDNILSIFSGSGSDACAAIETGRNSVSIEREYIAINLIKKRIKDTYNYAAKITKI